MEWAAGSVCPRLLLQKVHFFSIIKHDLFLNLNLKFLRLLIIITIMTKNFIEQLLCTVMC